MPIMGAQEEIQVWGTHANCYAYAMNCTAPVNGSNGGAWVGSQATHLGNPPANGASWAQKVVADSGGLVAQVAGTPLTPPGDIPGHYIVAMLAHPGGFHFIRRDSHTGRWHWKDGNGGSVKFNVLDFPASRYVYINSSNLNDLLVARPADFNPWAYRNMAFQAYFRVPDGGSTVRGR
jgi:hypothetical protein